MALHVKNDWFLCGLKQRLWDVHDVKLRTKVNVFKAAVLTTLLYGCETWKPIVDMLNALNSSSNVVCAPCAVSSGKIWYPILKY